MTIRVMTWNLWWRFGPWAERQPAIESVLRDVDPDIVCLQEVWSSEAGAKGGGDAGAEEDTDGTDQVQELADALGMHAVRTDPVFWEGFSFGNAILSRWPLERFADEPLPKADGTPGHRRVVAARVDTPFGAWPVASTHLEYRFDASATRELQCRRLMELAAQWRGDPENDLPIILGGDLNAVPDSDEIRLLTGRRPGPAGIVFSDIWEQKGEGDGHTWRADNPYCGTSAWPNRRIDYLMVSWPRPRPAGNPKSVELVGHQPVRLADGESLHASDHAAVVADLLPPGE